MLRGQPLEQVVGGTRIPHVERAVARIRACAVEDHHAARASLGDEAGEPIDESLWLGEAAGVEQVVAVEEVERCGSRTTLRCLAASKSAIPAATLTFSDSTSPASGIENASSHARRTPGLTPLPSEPKTSAAPVVKSAAQTGVSASPSAAHTQRSLRFTSPR